MKRREFITLLGSAAAWPLAAHAQQAGKLPTIGFFGQTTRSAASEWVTAFVQRLRELAWVDGRNLAIEYRWADGPPNAFWKSRQSSFCLTFLKPNTVPALRPSDPDRREHRTRHT
jgi:hypothetical protein